MERDREIESKRERHKWRETKRQSDREMERERERLKWREAKRQSDRETQIERDRDRGRGLNIYVNIYVYNIYTICSRSKCPIYIVIY